MKVINKFEHLKEGELYMIDFFFKKKGRVRLITKGTIICVVEDVETKDIWTTMLNRLSLVDNETISKTETTT